MTKRQQTRMVTDARRVSASFKTVSHYDEYGEDY